MKTAVCLVVKDECLELPYWFAWYKAIGFDSFIVYDDFSEDSTENVILSLKEAIDIRYKRNSKNKDLHNIRQVRAYNDAVKTYADEFDWIALFDADEYLSLHGKTIKDYLSHFDNADCIAFNWACSGSNGNISRPAGLPLLAYPYHGGADLYWNKHTKVIFRPKKLSGVINQVHNVPVRGATVSCCGKPIEWASSTGGFTAHPPSWEGGILFHFQSRSLEHYVKRDKHLEDVRRDKNDPLHEVMRNKDYDKNKINIDEKYIERFYYFMMCFSKAQSHWIQYLIRENSDFFYLALSNHFSSPDVEIFSPPLKHLRHEIDHRWVSTHTTPGEIFHDLFVDSEILYFHIEAHFGKFLCEKNGYIVASGDYSPLVACYIKGSSCVHIFSPDIDKNLLCEKDPRINSVMTYEVWKNLNGSISLSHPTTELYLTSLPDGQISANRKRAFAWEEFQVSFIDEENCPSYVVEISNIIRNINNIQNIKDVLMDRELKYPRILYNIFATFRKKDKDILRFISSGILSEYLV